MTSTEARHAVLGPGARWLWRAVYASTAVLTASAVYLAAISLAEWSRGEILQGYVYQWALLAHLAVGVLVVVPFLAFVVAHLSAAWTHPNRRAARIGYLLAGLAVVALVTGLALLRVGGFDLKQPALRAAMYWLHVVSPFAALWAFGRHRRRGQRLSASAAWTGQRRPTPKSWPAPASSAPRPR